MKKRVLFINHNERQCGVFQFGDIVAHALMNYSKDIYWTYVKTTEEDFYWRQLEAMKFDAVVFNYHPAASSLANRVINETTVPTFGIVHEDTWFKSDPLLQEFDYLIFPDITCTEPKVFTTNRTIPDFLHYRYFSGGLRFGSFGFAFGGKGYSKVIEKVQDEFDEAEIRLHIPFARFGDEFGNNAKYAADECRSLVTKPGIKLTIHHEFFELNNLIQWLADNTINCFFYDQYPGRGISSTIDLALAARRPIAITDSNMFRHIKPNPSIRIEDSPLAQIIQNGIEPLEPFYKWTEENTAREYEAIMKKVLL